MFTLVNPSGNAQRVVRSEVKKEALLKEGWKPVEETPSVTAGAVPPPSGREAEEPDTGAAPAAAEGDTEPDAGAAPAATEGDAEPDSGAAPAATEGDAEPDAGAAPAATEGVSEPELPKAPKNKRKGASAGVPAEEE